MELQDVLLTQEELDALLNKEKEENVNEGKS